MQGYNAQVVASPLSALSASGRRRTLTSSRGIATSRSKLPAPSRRRPMEPGELWVALTRGRGLVEVTAAI